jgi:hypothetical protein
MIFATLCKTQTHSGILNNSHVQISAEVYIVYMENLNIKGKIFSWKGSQIVTESVTNLITESFKTVNKKLINNSIKLNIY